MPSTDLSPKKLHAMAMEALDQAQLAKIAGNFDLRMECLERAFESEARAAELLCDHLQAEPTRGVLYRSAGWIALQLGRPRAAEIMACKGLMGTPPDWLLSELRDLQEQANWKHHLELRGQPGPAEGFVMALSGPAVGYGYIEIEEMLRRAHSVQLLSERTVERLYGDPYDRDLDFIERYGSQHRVYAATPHAASFGMSFYIGGHDPVQTEFEFAPRKVKAAEIVTELFECLEILNTARDQLRDRFKDEAHFWNFVNLAKDIAPDGTRVNGVHFRAIQGEARPPDLHLTRRFEPTSLGDLSILQDRPSDHGKRVTVEGTLKAATTVKRERLTVVQEDGSNVRVEPTDGLEALVRDCFGRPIRVHGTWKVRGRGKVILATEIERLSTASNRF